MVIFTVRRVLALSALGACTIGAAAIAAPCPPDEQTKPSVTVVAPGRATVSLSEIAVEAHPQAIILRKNGEGKEGIDVILRTTENGDNQLILTAPSIQLGDAKGNLTGTLAIDINGVGLVRPRVVELAKVQPKVQIGVVTEPTPLALAKHLKLELSHGLMVTEVLKNLPAAKAGLQKFDVIMRVDDVNVVSQEALKALIKRCKPGQEITLGLLRQGDPVTAKITVVPIDPAKQPSAVTTYEVWSDTAKVALPTWTTTRQNLNALVTIDPTRRHLEWLAVDPQNVDTAIALPSRTGVQWVTVDPKISDRALQLSPSVVMRSGRGNPLTAVPLMGGVPLLSDLFDASPGEEDLTAQLKAEIAALRQQLARIEKIVAQINESQDD